MVIKRDRSDPRLDPRQGAPRPLPQVPIDSPPGTPQPTTTYSLKEGLCLAWSDRLAAVVGPIASWCGNRSGGFSRRGFSMPLRLFHWSRLTLLLFSRPLEQTRPMPERHASLHSPRTHVAPRLAPPASPPRSAGTDLRDAISDRYAHPDPPPPRLAPESGSVRSLHHQQPASRFEQASLEQHHVDIRPHSE